MIKKHLCWPPHWRGNALKNTQLQRKGLHSLESDMTIVPAIDRRSQSRESHNYCYNKHISCNSHHKRSQNIPTSLGLWHYYTVQFVSIQTKLAECIVVGFERNPANSQSKNQRERKQVWQACSRLFPSINLWDKSFRCRIHISIFLKIFERNILNASFREIFTRDFLVISSWIKKNAALLCLVFSWKWTIPSIFNQPFNSLPS